MSTLVSVVVPTRNSGETLRACLESIAQQQYPNIEIVVVDNNSTDRTRNIAHSFTPLVLTQGPERSAQRNAGARAGRGSYILFIDSDMVLDSRVIAQCVRAVTENPAIKGLIIPERSVGEGFWARCKALERRCYVGDDSIEAARFFERDMFEKVHGYDEMLTGPEDWDLSQRVKSIATIGRISAFITHLEGRLTLRETMRSKFYYGKTMRQYVHKQTGTAARQLQLVRPAFIRHRRWLLAQPILTLGMVVMKTCEYAAGAAGMVTALWPWRQGINRTAL